MFGYLPFIIKSSMRSKRRSLLTMASAAISLCLLGTLMAIYHGFYIGGQESPQQALRVITRNRVSPAIMLPISYRNKIRQVPGVAEVMPFQYFGGIYKDPKNNFARYAVEPERIFILRSDYKVPDDQKLAFQKEKTASVIGRGLANTYGLKIGDRVTLTGDIFPVNADLIVRGIYDNPFDNDLLFFRLDYLLDLLPERRKNEVFAFQVLADRPESVMRICRQIDDVFRNSTAQTKSEAERAFELNFISMLGDVKKFLLSISLALTFTLLLVTANTMAMAVRERIREVGVLKTLGFTSPVILGMIIAESALLTLTGGLMGCGLAWFLVSVIKKIPTIIVPLSGVNLDPSVAAVLVLIGVCAGAASAFIPAWRVVHKPILEALRSTD